MMKAFFRYCAARRLIKDRKGAAAVEFALIATPFFMLIMATLEVALYFIGATMIENSLSQAARGIRTGVVQASGQDLTDFRDTVCQQIDAIADCSRLYLDVRTFDSFGDSDFTDPLDSNGELEDDSFRFDPGGASEVVVVRAFYEWQLFVPGALSGMSNMSGNKRLISATTVFRNEPFE